MLTCKITEITHDMKIEWSSSPAVSVISKWVTEEQFNSAGGSKVSKLTVPKGSSGVDRKYTCTISSTQKDFEKSISKNFLMDLGVYGELSLYTWWSQKSIMNKKPSGTQFF